MYKTLPFLALMMPTLLVHATMLGEYDVSKKLPFGQKHPDAPLQIADYQPMIGKSQCLDIRRNTDGSWQQPIKMDWVFKYIMNGTAVQDETYKEDGSAAGSIRQFDKKTKQWFVHYYTSTSQAAPLSYWVGKREKDKIVLTRRQKSFSGQEGSTRLTFHSFEPKGFKWLMEWMSLDKKTVYAIRKIHCEKVK